MTATDELCRMLAKMGVEYALDEEYGKKYPPEQCVTWSCDIAGEDMTVTARDYCIGRDESGEWEYCLDLEFHEVFTPAQAIAATVGRGTCVVTKECKCSACGWQYPCRNYETYTTCDGRTGYRNSFRLYNECGTVNFCPNCGAKVVGE